MVLILLTPSLHPIHLMGIDVAAPFKFQERLDVLGMVVFGRIVQEEVKYLILFGTFVPPTRGLILPRHAYIIIQDINEYGEIPRGHTGMDK